MLDQLKAIFERVRKGDGGMSLRLSDAATPSSSAPRKAAKGEAKILAKVLATEGAGRTRVTFAVDDVAKDVQPLLRTTLGESLELRAGTSVIIMPDQSAPAVAPEGFLTRSPGIDQHNFLHPLIETVHLAFSEHRPLVVSPDCIWLTILQGFGNHVQINAEALRGRIVRHEGKKTLSVEARSLEPEVWPHLISQFSEQIRQNSDPVLHETLLCDFSTTTATIKTACEVALMDAYQRYFEYDLSCICGIPTVTLEGTPDDWQRIRERIEMLATFGLEWWTARLAPILDEFVNTAKGTPDLTFWQAIYKPQKRYVTNSATGWIADLFPYLGNPPHRVRNFLLGKKRVDWLPEAEGPERGEGSGRANLMRATADDVFGQRMTPGVGLSQIPCGLSLAPLTIHFPNGEQREVELLGGFIGLTQSDGDLALAPAIGWAVVAKDTRVPGQRASRKPRVQRQGSAARGAES